MKVVPFDKIEGRIWDELCDQSDQAWLFHRSSWVEIEDRFFDFQNRSFGLQQGSRLIAIQPLYVSDYALNEGKEHIIHSGIHRHTGLAIRREVGEQVQEACRKVAMREIGRIAELEDVDRVQLNVHNLTIESLSDKRQSIPFWVSDHGYQLGLYFGRFGMRPAPGMATCNADQIVNLNGNSDERFAALSGSCRRAVRKANSYGLRLRVARNRTDVAGYYDLAAMSATRTGEVLPSIDYYYAIWDGFAANGRAALFFVLDGDVKAAGLWVLRENDSASFLAGVSDPERLHKRVNDYLHWSAMQWLSDEGCRWYRLGPTFPTVPHDWPIARVARFKAKLGGRPLDVIQGSWFRHRHKYRDVGFSNVEEVCAAEDATFRSG